MTRVSGVCLVTTPCCGATYAMPRYASINFRASEYWTDGWREQSLYACDEGLRRCTCGRVILQQQVQEVGQADASELPRLEKLSGQELGAVLAAGESLDPELEIAARITHWRHLNHPYREAYRLHRDPLLRARESAYALARAADKANWEAAHPDRRRWWNKLLRRPAPVYPVPELQRPPMPFTVPPFQPNAAQTANMVRLTEMLQAGQMPDQYHAAMLLPELLRQQSRFDAARIALQNAPADWQLDTLGKLVADLVDEHQPAPIRYQG